MSFVVTVLLFHVFKETPFTQIHEKRSIYDSIPGKNALKIGEMKVRGWRVIERGVVFQRASVLSTVSFG